MSKIKRPIPILSGQIRHPLKFPDNILKCRGPLQSETLKEDGSTIETELFYLTNEFPKPHYVIIDRILNNYIYPEHPHALVHLITHSTNYDNLKVTDDLYTKSNIKLDLSKSYVTRDSFLILIDNIEKFRVFGTFDMDALKKGIEY